MRKCGTAALKKGDKMEHERERERKGTPNKEKVGGGFLVAQW